tara:strand:- start:9471 stop:9812 length:342 start_codon:yes stop_codon:yes gene_type:complete
MSDDFFESPVVRAAAAEIEEIQQEMFSIMMKGPYGLSRDDKERQLELMRNLLEKQKIFYFRLKHTDDRRAVQMRKDIQESAKFLGLAPNQPIEHFYDNLTKTIDRLEESLIDD